APRPVEITLRLDKAEVTPGETVSLQELIPATLDDHMISIGHQVLRIGSYDRKLGKLVNLSEELFSSVNPDKVFDNLPGGSIAPHGLPFDIRTSKHKGIEYKFRANRLGIFLMTA